jgi:hypothetical protein
MSCEKLVDLPVIRLNPQGLIEQKICHKNTGAAVKPAPAVALCVTGFARLCRRLPINPVVYSGIGAYLVNTHTHGTTSHRASIISSCTKIIAAPCETARGIREFRD